MPASVSATPSGEDWSTLEISTPQRAHGIGSVMIPMLQLEALAPAIGLC